MDEDFDRAEEWRRLKEVYAAMSDGELEAVAEEGYDLSDIALPLLKEEIARRDLQIDVQEVRPVKRTRGEQVDPTALGLTVAARVLDIAEAQRIKAVLDAAAIGFYFGPDNLVNLEDYQGSFEGGVDLKVASADIAQASRAIAESSPEIEDANFVCPECKSPEIVLQGLGDDEATDSPDAAVVDSSFHWICDACGHEWTDDGIEKQSAP